MKRIIATLMAFLAVVAVLVGCGVKGDKIFEKGKETVDSVLKNEPDEEMDNTAEPEQEPQEEEEETEKPPQDEVYENKPNDTASSSTNVIPTEPEPQKIIVDYISESSSETADYKYGVKKITKTQKNYIVYSDNTRELEGTNQTFEFDVSGYKASDNELKEESLAKADENMGYYEEILSLVNDIRASVGVSPLVLDEALCRAATMRSVEMNYSSVFSHTRPDGRDFITVFDAFNIFYLAAGENIAAGQQSAAEVVEGWKNSPGHYENMINPEYTKLGVGMSREKTDKYGIYWTQLFKN